MRRVRQAWIKRRIDLLGAAVLLAAAAPVMLLVGLAVWRRMGRPVLFRQMRAGQHGRPMMLLKFRTMRDARDSEGRLLPDAERLTPLGCWLRRTSLDELPQLVSVLRGDMSLVGPRPLLMQYVERYTPEQRRRLEAKPGLTGWAQVRGRNCLSWEEKFRLDVWYVDHWSNLLDLRILLATVRKVLLGDGIGHGADPTMPEFTGTHTDICRADLDCHASAFQGTVPVQG